MFFFMNILLYFFSVDTPNSPIIMVYGNMKVGQSVTVECTVYHTCSTNPPVLSLNIPLQNVRHSHTLHPDGTTKTTLTTTWTIESDHITVQCSAKHMGGLKIMTYENFSAKCT